MIKAKGGKDGYKKLILWQAVSKLERMIRVITSAFPRSEYKRVINMNGAASSAKVNFQEGYLSGSPKEYINFLEIARGCLGELKGDLEDSAEDGLVAQRAFEEAYELACKTEDEFNLLIDSLASKADRDKK